MFSILLLACGSLFTIFCFIGYKRNYDELLLENNENNNILYKKNAFGLFIWLFCFTVFKPTMKS